MPSKDYYLAVSLLNSKNVFDWTKAVDMLTDKELQFIRKVFCAEDKLVFIKDRKKNGPWYNNKFWRIASRTDDILINTDAEVYQIIEVVRENKEELVVRVNRKEMQLHRKLGKLCFSRKTKMLLLHILVYETFVGNTRSHITFRDEDIYNCKLENLYVNKNTRVIKNIKRKSIESYKLYKHKEDIKRLRYKDKASYSEIGRMYNVTHATVRDFLVRLSEVEGNNENVQFKKTKQAV